MLAFLLVATVAAQPQTKSRNIYKATGITRDERWQSVGHKGVTLWMTGLSGSGKSTIAVALERHLAKRQSRPYFVYRLDGDNLRFGLNRDLGFAPKDRSENVRRVSEVSKLFADAGAIVVASLISPYAADRDYAREVHKNASVPFYEVYVDAPLATAESRDPKGLYKKARKGEIKGFTGLDAPYEAPTNAELHLRTDQLSVPESVNKILEFIHSNEFHIPDEFNLMEDAQLQCMELKQDAKEAKAKSEM